MTLIIEGDANQVRITNQCIELMTNFRASNGLLFLKSADREHINFIFQPNKETDNFDEEKAKAEFEWIERLQDMVDTEGFNTLLTQDEEDAYKLTFVQLDAKKKGKKRGNSKK